MDDQNKFNLSGADEERTLQISFPDENSDSLPNVEFELLARVAAQVFDMPVAVIRLTDSGRICFESQQAKGIPPYNNQIISCEQAIIQSGEMLVVEDLRQDHRFQDEHIVTDATGLIFYAGAPLVDRDENLVGVITVLDIQPRKFSKAQRSLLSDLSKVVTNTMENRNHANRLVNLAMLDHLTGLPNRVLFRDQLKREFKKSHRAGLALPLLIINLDRFREVNDALGHRKGDLILVEAARRISACVSEAGTVSRLGGDEFAVILSSISDHAYIEQISQCIIQKLNRPFIMGDDVAYISASIGITHYLDALQDVDRLLSQADQAMNKAKGTGRDQFCFYTPSMQQEAHEKLALTNDLRHALSRNQLHVYYQPIVNLQTGKITKGEALLRWKHPERGMVSPTIFIPLAEESGLIHAIGDWVFHEAVTCVERWYKQYGRTVQIGINKSPIQLAKKAKQGEDWGDKLGKFKLPINSIKVEITEGVLLKDSPTIKMKLINYQNNGVEVSIDDFGTGFSSLSYLKKFNVDYLKIDQSFIGHLTDDETDRAVTEAIIMMAHKLGIKTIAEGVETKAQRDLLMTFGCDYAQGFLYSHAIPAMEFENLIASQA